LASKCAFFEKCDCVFRGPISASAARKTGAQVVLSFCARRRWRRAKSRPRLLAAPTAPYSPPPPTPSRCPAENSSWADDWERKCSPPPIEPFDHSSTKVFRPDRPLFVRTRRDSTHAHQALPLAFTLARGDFRGFFLRWDTRALDLICIFCIIRPVTQLTGSFWLCKLINSAFDLFFFSFSCHKNKKN